MEKVLFKEEQEFKQWWIWLIMVFALLAVLISLVEVITEEQGTVNSSDPRLILYGVAIVLFLTAVIVVLFFVKLKTKITYDGIYVAYLPLIRKWKKIAKDDIVRYELRKYHAVLEYGGHGLKTRRKAGKAYTISGNTGLQLYLSDGKKLLIGTQKKQAIKYAMVKLIGEERTKSAAVKNPTKQKSILGGRAKKFLIIILIEAVLVIVILSLLQIFK